MYQLLVDGNKYNTTQNIKTNMKTTNKSSNSERLSKFHQRVLRQFDYIQTAVQDERLQCLDDRRFVSIPGAQWEGALGDKSANRPRLEFNKIALAVTRIINEYRNNPISVDFVSRDGSTDQDRLADTLDGLYRADESQSTASEAYDCAFEEAVTGGFGAFRLITKYEDEFDPENENQRVSFEPIPDADSSVFFDLNAKRQDKSDAKFAFVITAMDRTAYEDQYGDDISNWPKDIQRTDFDWSTPDVVYVAEYYEVEIKSVELSIYSDIEGIETTYRPEDFELDPTLETELTSTGSTLVRKRKIKEQRVHKYILSGGGILEDLGIIAGRYIPIVPVYGRRFFIDNIERTAGVVRQAKDAQRLKNMQLSKLAEISSLSSTEKPILTPQQIMGHQVSWAEDNIKNNPYLLLNPVTAADGSTQVVGPLGYTRPPAIPPALGALLQTTEVDMNDILGNAQQADQMLSGVSGKAVEMIQSRVDGQAYIYTSNFSKAIKRSGEIWLEIAREIYSGRRQMKTISPDGVSGVAELMKPVISDSGKLIMDNDIARARFDVSVEVGPSSSSKRQATVRALTGMIGVTADPEISRVLTMLALTNMDGEGLVDARGYFRKSLVRMGVLKPTEDELKALQAEMMAQGNQVDPNTQYLMAASREAEARATKANVDTIKTMAEAEYTRAKTAEIAGNIESNDLDKLAKLQQISATHNQNTMVGSPPNIIPQQ